jgi:hypothetical protein
MNSLPHDGGKGRIIRMEKIKASKSFEQGALC